MGGRRSRHCRTGRAAAERRRERVPVGGPGRRRARSDRTGRRAPRARAGAGRKGGWQRAGGKAWGRAFPHRPEAARTKGEGRSRRGSPRRRPGSLRRGRSRRRGAGGGCFRHRRAGGTAAERRRRRVPVGHPGGRRARSDCTGRRATGVSGPVLPHGRQHLRVGPHRAPRHRGQWASGEEGRGAEDEAAGFGSGGWATGDFRPAGDFRSAGSGPGGFAPGGSGSGRPGAA